MNSNDLYREITRGRGYAILKIDDIAAMERFRVQLLQRISGDLALGCIHSLRTELCLMANKDINSLMIKLLGFPEAADLMLLSCADVIRSLCGSKVFLQRRANIIFNLPGDEQRHQWPHYELMSGISPYTFVLWTPLHDIDDGSGLFYLDSDKSLSIMRTEIEKGLVNGPFLFSNVGERTPVRVNYGEVIIFNPFIIHGNVPFSGTKARIACSIRVQGVDKPLMQRNTDFFKYVEF